MEWISNDFERQLRYKIAHYDYLDTFPKMADFGVNQSDFDDYVIEKQSVLDMEGNARKPSSHLFIALLCVVCLSRTIPSARQLHLSRGLCDRPFISFLTTIHYKKDKAKTIEGYVSSSNREVYRSSKSVFCEAIKIINASENIKKVN